MCVGVVSFAKGACFPYYASPRQAGIQNYCPGAADTPVHAIVFLAAQSIVIFTLFYSSTQSRKPTFCPAPSKGKFLIEKSGALFCFRVQQRAVNFRKTFSRRSTPIILSPDQYFRTKRRQTHVHIYLQKAKSNAAPAL